MLQYIIQNLTANTQINPIKILILFFSMTILSVFLDEIGFFRFLANATLKKSGASQKKLFVILYFTVSILTVFTSNDIIVLTFTPFICYFCSSGKLNPVPYLVTVFIAANTWSMALIIGNPTNIYLATFGSINFVGYILIMIIPTIIGGLTSFALLYLCFKNQFSKPIQHTTKKSSFISSPVLLFIGIIHLVAATILLALSSYIKLQMWIVAACSAASLFICNLIYSIFARHKPIELLRCLQRAPWTLIPFLLGMFILILILKKFGIPDFFASVIGTNSPVFKYGILSALSCNIINNIPMSVLFSSIIESASAGVQSNFQFSALFASIIGSNLGAFLTPLGALAGLMWLNILKQQKIQFGTKNFIGYGFKIGLPTLIITLASLWLEFKFLFPLLPSSMICNQ